MAGLWGSKQMVIKISVYLCAAMKLTEKYHLVPHISTIKPEKAKIKKFQIWSQTWIPGKCNLSGSDRICLVQTHGSFKRPC